MQLVERVTITKSENIRWYLWRTPLYN